MMRPLRPIASVISIVALLGGLLGGVAALVEAAPAAAAVDVTILGHGWGHGRGMGQWGAQGYAANYGWSASQIVNHFYGGTTPTTVSGSTGIAIIMGLPNSGSVTGYTAPTTVHVDSGTPFISAAGGAIFGAPDSSVRISRTGAGTLQVQYGPSCGGPWTAPVATGDNVRVIPAGGDQAHMIQLCDGAMSGGSTANVRYVRNEIRAVSTSTRQYTINDILVEDYLKGVVPRESPASWASAALQAQAIAARSYALADASAKIKTYGFAATCDTTACQVYGGYREVINGSVVGESTSTNNAVAATVGMIRMTSGGAVARTEFSSSTGGWSAGGTFPAVEDLGDAISSNPNHNWSKVVSSSTIESAYGKPAGSFQNVVVTARNGLGAEGGRATQVTITFAGSTVTASGVGFASTFGLKSDWFSVSVPPPPTTTTPTTAPTTTPTTQPTTTTTAPPPPPPPTPDAGGWLLRSDGTLSAFGGAPARSSNAIPGSLARAVDMSGTGGMGYILDGWGGRQPIGGAPTSIGPFWQGWDIANDLVLQERGDSGYVLDGWGGVHAFGVAPEVASGSQPPGYSSAHGDDWALRLALRTDEASGYVVFADAHVEPWNGAPAVTSPSLPAGRTVRGLILAVDDRSGWVVLDNGTRLSFGGAAAASSLGASGVVGTDQRHDATGVAATGSSIVPFGGIAGGTPTSGAAAGVDVALALEPAGYVLDGWGGPHAVGGAAPATTFHYTPGHDDARKVVVGPAGNGFVMDRFGNLFGFGTAAAAAPTATGNATWPGWDIARDVVLIPGTLSGYVLDGWGGVHAFNGAPAPSGVTYWQGWDIARAIVLDPDGNGGYTLDGWGGVHPFLMAGRGSPPAVSGMAYTPGQDRWIGLALTGPGRGATLASDGTISAWGGAAGGFTPAWPGGRAVGLATDNPNRGWATGLNGFGATAGALTPTAGYLPAAPGWPGWDIARDIAFH